MPVSRAPNMVAKGQPDGAMLKTVIILHPEVHAQIAEIAKRERTSFAEQVRILVEIGLESEAVV
jgi:hypothetical protein